MTRTLFAALTAFLLALGLAASPASAATRVQTDPRNPQAPGSFDIRTVEYNNGGRYLTIKIKVRNLRDVDMYVDTEFSIAPMRADGQNFRVYATRSSDGRSSIELVNESREFGQSPISCRGLRRSFNVETDRISMRVPQFCLGEGTGTQRLETNAGIVHRIFDKTKPATVRRR